MGFLRKRYEFRHRFSGEKKNELEFSLGNAEVLSGWYMLEIEFTNCENYEKIKLKFDKKICFGLLDELSVLANPSKLTKQIIHFENSNNPKKVEIISENSLEGEVVISVNKLITLFAIYRIRQKIKKLSTEKKSNFLDYIYAFCNINKEKKICLYEKYLSLVYFKKFDYIENRQIEVGSFNKVKSDGKKIIFLVEILNSKELDYLECCLTSISNQIILSWEVRILTRIPELDLSSFCYDKRIKSIFIEAKEINNFYNFFGIDSGEMSYFSMIRPYDILDKNAFFELSKIIDYDKSYKIIYFDNDHFDISYKKFTPIHKPSWNPDLLLSTNYMSKGSFLHSSLVDSMNEINFYSLHQLEYLSILLNYDELSNQNVLSFPITLYHCRSFDKYEDEKLLRIKNSDEKKALIQYMSTLEEKNKPIILSEEEYGFRLRRKINAPIPFVSLIIPSKNNYILLSNCINSILNKTEYKNFEIIIIDNGSTCRKTMSLLSNISSDSKIRILKWNKKFNYSAINNYAAKYARGEILGLLNDDVEVINSDWLTELVSQAIRNDIGCVGAKLYYPNGTIQHAGVVLGIGGIAGHAHRFYQSDHCGYMNRLKLIQNYSAVTGACLFVKSSIYNLVEGMNAKNLAVSYNDVDFCLRVGSLGLNNLWTPYAKLYHHESATRGKDNTMLKKIRARKEEKYMQKKWGSILMNDPAYNVNLTLSDESFSLK